MESVAAARQPDVHRLEVPMPEENVRDRPWGGEPNTDGDVEIRTGDHRTVSSVAGSSVDPTTSDEGPDLRE